MLPHPKSGSPGWLSSVSGYVNGITYNARGQKTQLTYANNLTTTWTYDANNFRVSNKSTSSNQQNLNYGYDNNGNITAITDNLFTGSRSFGYDDLNRLTSASGTFGTNQAQTSCTYDYDAIGNITNKCGATFTYGDSMHPSAVTSASGKSYAYDANGNMTTRGTQTLTWDIDNRVSSISIQGGGTTYMSYDYTGMRVEKNAPSGISLYPFQGYEIDPNGVITKYIRIGVENVASKKGTTKYFYHNDHLGSVNVITDINGNQVQLNEYDPWGSVSKSSGSIEPTHRFTGKELDPESGLYYYGGRYYDPEISRFASPDPFVQAPDDPQNLNRYSYVINNPQDYIDPSGYSFWSFLKKFFFWNHRIFMDSNLAHLDTPMLAAREFTRGTAKTIFTVAERIVVTAAVSIVTWNPGLGGLAGASIGAAAGAALYTAEMGGDPLQVLKAGAIAYATVGFTSWAGGGDCALCGTEDHLQGLFGLANMLMNEVAGLRGGRESLHAAQLAMGHVALNRAKLGMVGGLPPEVLTDSQTLSIAHGDPNSVAAYRDALTVAKEVVENPNQDPTRGATLYIQDYGQRLPSYYRGPARLTFGPFLNAAGGGDVPKDATVYIRVFP